LRNEGSGRPPDSGGNDAGEAPDATDDALDMAKRDVSADLEDAARRSGYADSADSEQVADDAC
jgi:hypothetical protein